MRSDSNEDEYITSADGRNVSSPHGSSHAEESRRALGLLPFLDSHFGANVVLRYMFPFSSFVVLLSCLFPLLTVCGGAFQLLGCATSSSLPVWLPESFLRGGG